jgi:hypothetical protein
MRIPNEYRRNKTTELTDGVAGIRKGTVDYLVDHSVYKSLR